MKAIKNENVAEIQISYKPTNIQNLFIGSSKNAFDVLNHFIEKS
jgi:hypothetical protein